MSEPGTPPVVGIIGGSFVPVLMLILWLGGAFAPRCPSPFKKGGDPTKASTTEVTGRA